MTNTQKCLSMLKLTYQKILSTNLVGIYLHGSYVMHSYNASISDLDYIVVVKTPLSFSTKQQLMTVTLKKLWPLAPAKGLEFHVLRLSDTQHFRQPLPFDFHFSKMHFQNYLANPAHYIEKMHGTDPDLAAHLTIINHFGQVLVGTPIIQVFDQVPEIDYWQSIIFDIQDAQTNILKQPVYTILNLCRVLAYKQERLITSKQSGGQWGLTHLDSQMHPLIQQALHVYTKPSANIEFKALPAELTAFATKMLWHLGL